MCLTITTKSGTLVEYNNNLYTIKYFTINKVYNDIQLCGSIVDGYRYKINSDLTISPNNIKQEIYWKYLSNGYVRSAIGNKTMGYHAELWEYNHKDTAFLGGFLSLILSYYSNLERLFRSGEKNFTATAPLVCGFTEEDIQAVGDNTIVIEKFFIVKPELLNNVLEKYLSIFAKRNQVNADFYNTAYRIYAVYTDIFKFLFKDVLTNSD